ncbi:MAG: hypothetical protein H6Q76_414 [Firmicutes bacterium]|nr:hypothetical protein [Bacillota bacterium]
MKNRWAAVLAISFCLLLMPSVAFAEEWPVTSPFGWRMHPILGIERFHDGVDFGLEEGVAVPAAAAGTVLTSYGVGSGHKVEIDHGDGTSTEYLHLSGFAVKDGDRVSKGQTIGYVGSTGWSTGPHLHLSYYVNDVAENPIPYLQAQGWAISNIPDPSRVAEASPFDVIGFNDGGEKPWDFSSFYEFAECMQEIITLFAEGSKTAMAALQTEAVNLLWLLAVIDLAWFAGSKVLSSEVIGLNEFVVRILKYGFVLYLINNWPNIVNEVIGSIFSTGATEFFGGATTAADNFSRPGDVVQKGVHLIEPAFVYISKANFLVDMLGITLCTILALAIMGVFTLIGIWLVMYHLEFYITAVVAVISLPFSLVGGLFASVKNFPSGVIGSLIGSAIKILIASIVITIVIQYLSAQKPVVYEFIAYIKILVSSLLFLILVKRIPSNVARMLQGRIDF